MKANVASLINAIILISMGTWGYLDSESKAVTALIPVVIGVVLLLVNKGVQKENKVIARVKFLKNINTISTVCAILFKFSSSND